MPIPDYQTLMLPLRKSAQDGAEHTMRQAVERLAVDFSLSQEEQTELLPSGQQVVFTNRVSWARFHLKKAGLIDSPRRGSLKIACQSHHIELWIRHLSCWAVRVWWGFFDSIVGHRRRMIELLN